MRTLALLLLVLQSAPASDLRCEREAEITPVLSDFHDKSNPCNGSVKLQGIRYLCGDENEVDLQSRKFLDELNDAGEKECARFCKNKGRSCTSYFEAPSRCGFTLPQSEAISIGKNDGQCSKSCPGQAFIYCSLYHSSYLQVDEKLFGGFSPNCFCK